MDHTPELPPHLKSLHQQEDDDGEDYCPELPPHLASNTTFNSSKGIEEEEEDDDLFCPAMPPHLSKKKDSPPPVRILGPTLPDNFQPILQNDNSYSESHSNNSDNDDGEFYGPLPAAKPVDMDEYVEQIIEKRSNAMKEQSDKKNSSSAPVRETWMLELPEDKPMFAGMGLQARQFTRKGKTDRGDTSVWTDTPADKEMKAQKTAAAGGDDGGEGSHRRRQAEPAEPPTAQEIAARERDEKLQAVVDDYNAKKRPASMVEAHARKKKARKGADDTSVTGVGRERKPFSREDDLHVNKFDEAQRTSILGKAKQLNDRFSSGKTAKYL